MSPHGPPVVTRQEICLTPQEGSGVTRVVNLERRAGEAVHIGLLRSTAKMAGPPIDLKKWRRDPEEKRKASLGCHRAFD